MKKLIFSLSLFSIGIASSKIAFGSIDSNQACDGNYSDSSISNNNTPGKSLEIGVKFELSIEDLLQKNSIRGQSQILTFNVNSSILSNSGQSDKKKHWEEGIFPLSPKYKIDYYEDNFPNFGKGKIILPRLLNLNLSSILQTNDGKKSESPKEQLSQVNLPHFNLSLIPPQLFVEENYTAKKSPNNDKISAKKNKKKKNKKKVKPFKCKICNKRFKQNSYFIRHYRTHTGDRPFKCKECDKTFSQKSNLRQHMGIHRGERPFKCEECDKRFTQKGNLKAHERIHRGERLFKCSTCSKDFFLKGNLTKHIKRRCCKAQIKD